MRNPDRDRMPEEDLGQCEEAGSDEKSSEHGRGLPSDHLHVPEPIPRERGEEGGRNEREGQDRERRENRNRPSEKSRHEIQEDEGEEAHRDAHEEEPHLLFGQKIGGAPREGHEPRGGERGAERHPDDLRAVERMHRLGCGAARPAGVNHRRGRQEHAGRNEGKPPRRPPHPPRKREDEGKQKSREEGPRGVFEDHGGAEEPVDGRHGRESEHERDGQREAREEERFLRRRRGPHRRETRREERDTHREEEEVPPVPRRNRNVPEGPERIAPQDRQLGGALGKPARGITRLPGLGAVHEQQEITGLEAGSDGGVADAAHAKALGLRGDEHVGVAERRDLPCETKRGGYERRREAADEEPPRQGAQPWRRCLHIGHCSKQDANDPIAWITLKH